MSEDPKKKPAAKPAAKENAALAAYCKKNGITLSETGPPFTVSHGESTVGGRNHVHAAMRLAQALKLPGWNDPENFGQ